MRMMKMIQSPYGDVVVTYDGKMIPFECERVFSHYFSDIKETYRMTVHIKPDGKEHELKLVVLGCNGKRDNDSGEMHEGNAYYCDNGELHIGCRAAFGLEEDYSLDYEGWAENDAINVLITPNTLTEDYYFLAVWAKYDQIADRDEYNNQMVMAADTYVSDDYYDLRVDPSCIIDDALALFRRQVRVTCVNGDVLEGEWIDWEMGDEASYGEPYMVISTVMEGAEKQIKLPSYDIKAIESVE